MSQYDQNNENYEEDVRECEAMRKIFVGALNRDTTEQSFFEHFNQFGEMLDKVIIRDPQTKTSKGFGFITYGKAEYVENVFQGRPHVLDGKTLDVKRAMPKHYNNSASHSKTTKLFVGGISEDLSPEELQNYIQGRHPSNFGSVEKIDFLKDKETNKNKGFGFLECSDTDFADRLVICETSFSLNGKKMSIKKAEPKGEGAQGGRGGRGGRGGSYGGRGGGGQYGGYNNYNSNQGNQQGGYNNYSGYQQQSQYGQSYGQYPQQNYGGYGQQSGQQGGNRFQPY